MKRLALLLHHAGTAPDLIYPSLKKLNDVEIVTFFIKSGANLALNNVYDSIVRTIGPTIECKDEDDMVNKVKKYHNNHHLDGILTFAEMLLDVVSKLSNYIGKNYLSTTEVAKLQNKIKQRETLFENNVPVPKFYEINDVKDLESAAEFIGFPAVLKPNYGGGGSNR